MKNMKKLLSLLLVLAMVLALAACGGGKTPSANGSDPKPSSDAGSNAAAVKQHKIGVALYTDSGKSVDSIKAFLAGIAEDVGCEFVYTTLSTYDEATNLTAIQNLISAGCKGIIMTADMGTAAILEECQSANVYMAGFLCDFNMSMYTAYDAVFGNPNFLGTVCDGWADASPYGEMVAAEVIENGYKNVGVLVFPEYAYPNQTQCAAVFTAKIEEYNATAAEADKITVYEPTVLEFQPLADTYLSDHPEMDCLFSVAAGAGMVYPVLVSNNRTDVKLYTTGFEGTDDAANFGSKGNGCFNGVMFSTPEAIVYPLCLLIDKLNGTVYADLPATERVDCQPMIALNDEDMQKIVDHALYYNADYSRALLTGEQVKNMCASYNPNATYAQLVEFLSHTGVADLK